MWQWDAGSAIIRFFFLCVAKQISKLLMSSQDRLWEGCCKDGEVGVCHPVLGQGAHRDACFMMENGSGLLSASLQLLAA